MTRSPYFLFAIRALGLLGVALFLIGCKENDGLVEQKQKETVVFPSSNYRVDASMKRNIDRLPGDLRWTTLPSNGYSRKPSPLLEIDTTGKMRLIYLFYRLNGNRMETVWSRQLDSIEFCFVRNFVHEVQNAQRYESKKVYVDGGRDVVSIGDTKIFYDWFANASYFSAEVKALFCVLLELADGFMGEGQDKKALKCNEILTTKKYLSPSANDCMERIQFEMKYEPEA
jgi:hypothetical protein